MKDINQQLSAAKEARQKVVEDQKAILAAMREEKRTALTSDEQAQYDKAEADFNAYDQQVRQLNDLIQKEQRIALDQYTTTPSGIITDEYITTRSTDEIKGDYAKTFDKYLRFGSSALTSEERGLLRKHYDNDSEKRAQTVTTTAGGYAIPEGFAGTVEKIMSYYGPMLDPTVCGSLNTVSGNDIQYPTLNDTSNTGRLLTINTAVTTTDLTFGRVTFSAYKYSSDQILVPVELLEDEAVNLEQIIADCIGERLGRIMNTDLTTGDGSGKPNGIVTASAAGKTTAAPTAITHDEIIDLVHSVDRAYRIGPKVGFMLNDAVLAYIKKLSIGSGDDRPLWQPSVAVGAPDTLHGYRYWINNDMASSVATTNKTMLFGDFSKYMVRRVANMRMRRLEERYADTDQVGYVAFMRLDGDLIATGSVKHLVQA